MNSQSQSLQQLLAVCTMKKSHQWEAGWREFMKRYKRFIYKIVAQSCTTWNMPRLNIQFSEAVNDIVAEVFLTLCKDNCNALKKFQAIDSEPRFLAWMATICRRATGRYVQKYYSKKICETSSSDLQVFVQSLSIDHRWELHESVIVLLRQQMGRKKHNRERDILLFQLYAMSDFSMFMIQKLPCFKHLGHRVLDNVVNRLRVELRALKNILD